MIKKLTFLLSIIIAFSSQGHCQLAFHSIEEVWNYADIHNVNILTAGFEVARLSKQNLHITDSVYQSATNKYKQGAVSEISLNSAKLNLERSQQNEITARYQMATAKNNLRQLLNLALKDSLEVESSLQKT